VSYPIELVETKDGEPKIEQINRGSAPWQEQPASLDTEKHEELYKHLTHDWEGPLAHSHFRIEGQLEYVALLYVPKHAPEMLFDPQKAPGLKLFVKRVLVLDECELLLPPYLRFVRGLVDSDDLPLNVSRELLQDSSALRNIQKQLVKRVLDMLENVATERPDDYVTFTKNFGGVLKEGLASGADVSARLAKLVRFGSTTGESTSVDAYVTRMKEGQDAIYYATADNVTRLESAPQLEALRAKSYEVLLGTEAIDEFAFERLGEFEGKKLVSALRADLKLAESEDDKKRHETEQTELAPLLAAMKKILEGRVSDVAASARLTDSPACLVLGKAAMPAHLEKLFRQRGHKLPEGQRVLELNAGHPLVRSLLTLATKDADSTDLRNWSELLCDQAALAEGSELPDPARFAQSVATLLATVAASRATAS
jgi:molecular chaperone HtpG